MSEQLNKPIPQLPMSPPLLVIAALGPLATVQRDARKMDTITKAGAKAKTWSFALSKTQANARVAKIVGLPRPQLAIHDIGFALAAQPSVPKD
eukprot:6802444-Pyramimonas_sp.AAC.1